MAIDELEYYKKKTLDAITYYSLKTTLLFLVLSFLVYVYFMVSNSYLLFFAIFLLVFLLLLIFISSIYKLVKYIKDYYIIKDLHRYSNTLEVEVTDSKEEVDL